MTTRRKRTYKNEFKLIQNNQEDKYNTELNDLPAEVLLKIFEYLNFKDIQCIGRTCKRFNEITKSIQFLSKTIVKFKNSLLVDDELPILRFLYTNKLYKHFCIQTCRLGMLDKFFDKYGQYITTLILDDLSICENELRYILKNAPNLKILEMNYVYFHFNSINLTTISSILQQNDQQILKNFNNNKAQQLPKLKKLCLLRSGSIETIISFILPYLKNLNELTLNSCQIDNIRKYYYHSDEQKNTQKIIRLIELFSLTLEELIIDLDFYGYEQIEYNYLSTINNLKLKKFISCPCYDIDLNEFTKFITLQLNLKQLDLSLLYRMNDSMIDIICNQLINLESLNLFGIQGITDISLLNLNKLKNLKELDVSECINITSLGLYAGIAFDKNLKFRVLKMRNIESSVQVIVKIVRNLPNLRELDVSYCKNALKNTTVQAIFRYCRMLTHLNISGSDWINDCGITGVTQKLYKSSINNLKGLRWLDISDCRRITCETWQSLYLPDLIYLNITHPTEFCIDSIKTLLKKCPSIEKIVVTGITNRHANAIYEFSKRITFLSSLEYEKWSGRSMPSRFCGYNCCIEKRSKRKRTKTSFYGIENK